MSHATNRSLFRRLPFDPAVDFAPVALLAESPVILLGGPNLPAADLRALGVTSARRLPQAPEIPTVAESGVPGLADYAMTSWTVLLAPARTPASIVARLSAAVREARTDPAFLARLEALGNTLMDDVPPEAVRAFLTAEETRWGEVLRAAGIGPN